MAKSKPESKKAETTPVVEQVSTATGVKRPKADMLKLAEELHKASKGDSSLVKLDVDSLTQSTPHISTGAIALDYLIGGKENANGVRPCPGIPRGRISMIYGKPSSGKTTIALQTAASAIREGGAVLYIDFENEVEPKYASNLGIPVNNESLFQLHQPRTLEEGIKLLAKYAKGGVDLVVIDSVGAGVPQATTEKEYGEQGRIGLVASVWSTWLPSIKKLISETGTAVIGIAQLRESIATGPASYGGPQQSPQGGNAWKFYNSLQIMLRSGTKMQGKTWDALANKEVETVVGALITAKLDKCKVSDSMNHECSYYLMHGTGVDNVRTIIDLAIAVGVINKAGSWFMWSSPTGEVKGQGMDAFREKVEAVPNAVNILFEQVKPFLSGKAKPKSGKDLTALVDEGDGSLESLLGMPSVELGDDIFEEEE
jgi:recombination protein RecA